MQQAEPLVQISHGTLLTALFLICSQLLSTCIPCFRKHLLSNDPENNFVLCLQTIPEVPHLPARNQLVGGIFGWMTGGVFTCLQVTAGAKWPLLQLTLTALIPLVQLLRENPLLHTINRVHVCAPSIHSCSRAAGMWRVGRGELDPRHCKCLVSNEKTRKPSLRGPKPHVLLHKEGWQLKQLMEQWLCRRWWRRREQLGPSLLECLPLLSDIASRKRLLSTGRQKLLLTEVPRRQGPLLQSCSSLECWKPILNDNREAMLREDLVV